MKGGGVRVVCDMLLSFSELFAAADSASLPKKFQMPHANVRKISHGNALTHCNVLTCCNARTYTGQHCNPTPSKSGQCLCLA